MHSAYLSTDESTNLLSVDDEISLGKLYPALIYIPKQRININDTDIEKWCLFFLVLFCGEFTRFHN